MGVLGLALPCCGNEAQENVSIWGKKQSLQDLFSSWPQLWCCWAHRVSPQHCSLAPVWDIAQGSPPALSVRWMSITSPRTTDKLLRPPIRSVPRPSPASDAQPRSEWELPGASLPAGPCRTSRHPGEQNKLPQDWVPLPHDTHSCLWVWSAGIRRYCVRGQLYEGLLVTERWSKSVKHEDYNDRSGGNHYHHHSFSLTVVLILIQKLNCTSAQLETCEPCYFSWTGTYRARSAGF